MDNNNITIPPPKSLTEKTVQSGAWIYGRRLVVSILNLGVMAILARMLSPADFGLVALAQVILRFLVILGASGVGHYIIYDIKEGREERAHAAFWMNSALSIGVAILAILLLPLITRFYDQPDLGAILLLLILLYPLQQLALVPDALIKKNLDFHKLAVRDTLLEILSGIASVIMAITGWGVWSLVVPGLFITPLRIIMVMYMAHWRPSLPFRTALWPSIIRFSINILGSNMATTISAEGDTLIIGKILSSSELGLYNLAWQSANLVSRNVSSVVSGLAMPALSAVSDNASRLRSAFNRMLRLLGTVSFPLLVGLFVVADLFILTIYGSQWEASILPFRILLIYAMRHAVGSPASVIYNVIGRPDIGLKYGLAFIPFYLVSIFIGSQYGIVGVAVSVTIVRTVFGFIQFWIGARLVGESLSDLLGQFKQSFLAALCMGAVVFLSRLFMQSLIALQVVELIILIIIGGITYFILLVTIFRKPLSELLIVIDSLSHPIGYRLRRIARFA